MWPIIGTIFSTVLQPIKDYFAYKKEVRAAEQEVELATLQATTERIKSDNDSRTEELKARLDSTTRKFKQNTFYYLLIPCLFSMLFPDKAEQMWANFSVMPEWFRVLFVSVYSSIWALPLTKEYLGGMFSSAAKGLESRREYKLEKAKINREAAYAVLRAAPQFRGRGLDQATVDTMEAVFNAGENQ